MGTIALAFGVTGYFFINHEQVNLETLVNDFYANIAMELFGIVLTIIFLDRVNEIRADKRRKQELIFQMKSEHNYLALEAVEQLRFYDWIRDGSLHFINLWFANLENANLINADLSNARIYNANLNNIKIGNTIFEKANLELVTLQNIVGTEVNFDGARLAGVDLSDSMLEYSSFNHSNLMNFEIKNCRLRSTSFYKSTLYNITFMESELIETVFYEASLKHVKFNYSKLGSLNYVDFRKTNFQDNVIFEKVTLWGAKNIENIRFGMYVLAPDGSVIYSHDDLKKFVDGWQPKSDDSDSLIRDMYREWHRRGWIHLENK